ncbi:MAG: glutathione peroxidase [Bacillales bacterium]|jgi:glutathione peroxidase|nr:glutathione peroxidase [Bacillales bacterium]
MSLYTIDVKKTNGQEVKLSEYKDNVLLIVNTASKCGLTPQFDGLQKLYDEYKDQKFTILGFPCDQFAKQEFNDIKETTSFCKINYGVTFPIFSKIDVNGEQTHPLFAYLKSKKSGILGSKIKWNFTKFLVDRNGKVVKRFAPTTKPEAIKSEIEKLL